MKKEQMWKNNEREKPKKDDFEDSEWIQRKE